MFLLLRILKSVDPTLKIYVAAPGVGHFASRYQAFAQDFMSVPFRAVNPITVFRMLRFCRRNHINVIHSHGRGAGFYARILYLFGYKVLHTFHGIHQDKSFFGRLKFLIDYWLRNLIHHYICVSKSEQDIGLHERLCTLDNSTVILNGIEVEELSLSFEKLKREECRRRFNLSSDRKVIGVLARNDHAKGIELLLENFCYFHKKYPDQTPLLLIAGGGYPTDKCDRFLQTLNLRDHVRFVGEVRDQLPFLRAIDVYVSNSRWEGLPLSVLEAMSVKVPCLLSDAVGHRDLIQDGVHGHLFPLKNPEIFSRKLLSLLENEDKILVEKAFALVCQKFKLDGMASQISELYKKFEL